MATAHYPGPPFYSVACRVNVETRANHGPSQALVDGRWRKIRRDRETGETYVLSAGERVRISL